MLIVSSIETVDLLPFLAVNEVLLKFFLFCQFQVIHGSKADSATKHDIIKLTLRSRVHVETVAIQTFKAYVVVDTFYPEHQVFQVLLHAP